MVEKILIFFALGNLEGILISDWFHAKRENKALKTIPDPKPEEDWLDKFAKEDDPLTLTKSRGKKIKVHAK